MKKSQRAKDLFKFSFGVKAFNTFGLMIKNTEENYPFMVRDTKKWFGIAMNASSNFEKHLKEGLQELSTVEEDVADALIEMVNRIYDADEEELERILNYLDGYEKK